MVSKIIKKTRISMGLSQQKLAELSSLSIATIQNLEAGKGNPTLEVIKSVSSILNFDLELLPQKTDWDSLCHYGLGLMAKNDETKNLKKQRSKNGLKNLLISACLEIQNSKIIIDKERYRVAVEALILALKNHYGKFFKENLNQPIIKEFIPKEITGKHLKLYRYSKDILGQYL